MFRDELGLTQPDDMTGMKRLKEASLCGRPLGSSGFVTQIENALGRRL